MKFIPLALFGAIISSAVMGTSPHILLILLLSICIITNICRMHDIFAHSAKLVVLFVVVISVFLMPAYDIVASRHGELSSTDNVQILEFGAPLVLILSVAWYIFKPISYTKRRFRYRPKIFSDSLMITAFTIVFPISVFSYFVGLGRMGSAAVVLPFHLTGIFVFIQTKLMPALFVIYIENKILRKKEINRNYFICYAVWSFLMTLVMLSKSIFVSNFIPLLIMLYLYYKPRRKTVVKFLIPIIAIFFFMYPVIGVMRLLHEDNRAMNISSIMEAAYEDEENYEKSKNDNTLLKPLNRTFKTGAQLYYDYPIIKNDAFFDFSRMKMIMALGGSARYQTVVVEGYMETANHSSGTTGIMDPILVGGKGLMYITICIIMLFAACVDRMYIKCQFSVYAILIFFVFDLICNHNVSLIFEFTSLIVTLLSVCFAYYFNYRKMRLN